MFIKCAGDTKLGDIGNTLQDKSRIQNNLDQFDHWAHTNKNFKRDKCKGLHADIQKKKKKSEAEVQMVGGERAPSLAVACVKEIVYLIDHKLNMFQQCDGQQYTNTMAPKLWV